MPEEKENTTTKQAPAAPKKKSTTSESNDAQNTNILPDSVSLNLNNKTIIISLVIIIVFALIYIFKGVFIAALVNGTPISRLSIVNELEKTQGEQVLEAHINDLLILQEAEAQGVTVTQEEIDARITQLETDLEAQGGLDAILEREGLTREELKETLRTDILIERLLSDQVSITEEEIDTYIEENQDFIPEGLEGEELRETVRSQLRQQKLSTQYQTFISNLRANASINYFVEY